MYLPLMPLKANMQKKENGHPNLPNKTGIPSSLNPNPRRNRNPIHNQRPKPLPTSRRRLLLRDGSRSASSCKPLPTANNLSHRHRQRKRQRHRHRHRSQIPFRKLLNPLPPHTAASTRRIPPQSESHGAPMAKWAGAVRCYPCGRGKPRSQPGM